MKGSKGKVFPPTSFPHMKIIHSLLHNHTSLSIYFYNHTNKSSMPGKLTKISVLSEMREHWTENFCHLTLKGLLLHILTGLLISFLPDQEGNC
jgi:hypothetical protein